MSLYISKRDLNRLNLSLIGGSALLSLAFIWGVRHLPQSDARQAAMYSIHTAPRNTFEIVPEERLGPDTTVLVYKGSETFYPDTVKTAWGQPGRKVCSEIFLYHAQIRDGQIRLHYEPDQPTIINPGVSHTLWREGRQIFIPDIITHRGQAMAARPVHTQSICRIELL